MMQMGGASKWERVLQDFKIVSRLFQRIEPEVLSFWVDEEILRHPALKGCSLATPRRAIGGLRMIIESVQSVARSSHRLPSSAVSVVGGLESCGESKISKGLLEKPCGMTLPLMNYGNHMRSGQFTPNKLRHVLFLSTFRPFLFHITTLLLL